MTDCTHVQHGREHVELGDHSWVGFTVQCFFDGRALMGDCILCANVYALHSSGARMRLPTRGFEDLRCNGRAAASMCDTRIARLTIMCSSFNPFPQV